MLISIFNSNNNHEQSTTEIDGQFVQSQLLITSLLKMKTTSTDKDEFICKCRELYKDDKTQLHFVDEFERDYSSDFSLWWYTRETFLYRLLNKALRVQDTDLLFYSAQLMSIEELNLLRDSKNKLISMNSFLSTTRNLKLALVYFDPSTNDDKFQRVLFDINADPGQDSIKPFAGISKISVFQLGL
ncbi:unnamed protein product [Rotaria socialis]|uniref:Uncharacterized protein n=1 Tax=Rotaria socialis TaxID=392032 RepID=A0A821KJL2_9BILA|nr:unnamed protein product [Rotaria socialis]